MIHTQSIKKTWSFTMAHRTIIEQYDYMNLVEEIAWALFDTLMESTDNEEEFISYNLEHGDTFTDKGEKVFDGSLAKLKKSSKKEGYLKTLVEELNKETSWG